MSWSRFSGGTSLASHVGGAPVRVTGTSFEKSKATKYSGVSNSHRQLCAGLLRSQQRQRKNQGKASSIVFVRIILRCSELDVFIGRGQTGKKPKRRQGLHVEFRQGSEFCVGKFAVTVDIQTRDRKRGERGIDLPMCLIADTRSLSSKMISALASTKTCGCAMAGGEPE